MTNDIRKLRACLICGLVQSYDTFLTDGCPNCESFLSLRSSPDRILDSTTTSFSGLVALLPGGGSWVRRWLRKDNAGGKGVADGLYALRVMGRLNDELENVCAAREIRPVCLQ